MRFASDLLYRWLDAMGTGDSLPASQDLEIPPILLPIIQVVGPTRRLLDIVSTEVQRESFVAQFGLTRAASQAQVNTGVCRFGRGLWQVTFSLQHHADFTSGPGAVGAQAALVDPEGTDQIMMRVPNVANVPGYARAQVLLLFDVDGWDVNLTQGATAAAQTLHSSLDIIASRLN